MFSRKLTFYVLTNELEPDKVLTITNTEDECKEFYHKYLCAKHFHMFKPWCENQDLDYRDIYSWDKYYNAKVSSAEAGTYKVSIMKFTKKELAGLLRALSNCPLLGCSYEDKFDLIIRSECEAARCQ